MLLLAVLGCTLLVARVAAQEPETAAAERDSGYEALTARALAAFEAKQFTRARVLFEDAHRLRPSARTFRALGLTALAQDDYDRAKPELTAALADTREPLTPEQTREVTGWLDWMRVTLGSVQVRRSPPDSRVELDGKLWDRAQTEQLLMPGEHALRAEADGYHPFTQKFTIERERAAQLAVRLEPIAVPAPPALAREAASPQPAHVPATVPRATTVSDDGETWPWALGGVGVAAAVGGGVLFALALRDKAAVEGARDGVELSEIDAAHARVPWLSALGLGVSAAGLACVTAAVLTLSLDSDEDDARDARAKRGRPTSRLRAQIAPTHLSLQGSF